MKKVMVRVKPGHRIYENGGTRVAGQTLWVMEERLADLMYDVDVVEGVEPVKVQTTAMGQPAPAFTPKGIPQPEVRLTVPRMPEGDVVKPKRVSRVVRKPK